MKKLLTIFWFLVLASPALANVPCSLPFNLTNGTTADATQVMANYNAIITCLGNAAAAGNNDDITALLGLTTPLSPSEGGTSTFIGATSTGSANAQVVATTTPGQFTLGTGYTVVFVAGFINTAPGTAASALTLSVNGQTVSSTTYPTCSSSCAPSFFRQTPSGPQPMTGGEIQAGQLVVAKWDGTQFELMNSSAQFGGYGALTNLAAASTTSLGSIASHNIQITGSGTITSFGNTASLTYPVYQLFLPGGITIDYNETNCGTTGNCIFTPGSTNIVTQSGDSVFAIYVGAGSGGGGNWTLYGYSRATGNATVAQAPLCGANHLVILNNTGTPNTEINITADSAVMINPTGNLPFYTTSVSVTINDTTNGANGLDTGSLANNTFYFHYLISNGSTVAGLDSLSSSSPTMPSGYTYLCRMGASRTNGSANFYGFVTRGKRTQYVNGGANLSALLQVPVSQGDGSITIPTWVSKTVAANSGSTAFVPLTATDFIGIATGTGANQAMIVAPNNSYGAYNSASNAPPVTVTGAAGLTQTAIFNFQLESTAIYEANSFSGGASSFIYAFGWEDAVNAN
jgi:hypothetical protein